MLNYTIPWDTTEAWFHYNSITLVPSGYFRNLTNLDVIALGNNLISDVGAFAFVDIPSVTEILLQVRYLML